MSSKAPKPVGLYPHTRRVGNLLFLSGVGPRIAGSDATDSGVPGLTLAGASEDYSWLPGTEEGGASAAMVERPQEARGVGGHTRTATRPRLGGAARAAGAKPPPSRLCVNVVNRNARHLLLLLFLLLAGLISS